MTDVIDRQTVSAQRVDEIYASAVDEHREFLDLDEGILKDFIGTEAARIATFETVAREPLLVSPDVAEDIAVVRIHSGVGNYDEPVKPDDNPRLIQQPWLHWFDRRRIDHAVRLARKIAEVRSGYDLSVNGFKDLDAQREQARSLIAEYGPTLVYSGYPSETSVADQVLNRPGTIIPREKAFIVHGNPKNTVDGAKKMQGTFPTERLDSRQVAIVTHAPHLARVLHIMEQTPYLPEGSVPYIAPLATPEEGRNEFALMEIRGMLNYIFLEHEASQTAHAHQPLR